MHNYFSPKIILSTLIFTASSIVSMELVSPVDTRQHSSNYIIEQRLHRTMISAIKQENYPEIKRLLPYIDMKDLCYLVRFPDNGISAMKQRPVGMTLCPYTIARAHEDEATISFLKELGWGEKKPVDISSNSIKFLVSCITNDFHSTVSLLSQENFIQSIDREILKNCLYVAVDNNICCKSDENNLIQLLFNHPHIKEHVIHHDVKNYINFARCRTEGDNINFAVKKLKAIEGFLVFETTNNWLNEITKTENKSESEIEKLRKQIAHFNLPQELETFLLACIANDCNQVCNVIYDPATVAAIETYGHIVATFLYHVIENNRENPDQALVQLLFTHDPIIKHVIDYSAQEYINHAARKNCPKNYALQTLNDLQPLYGPLKAEYMRNDLAAYAKLLANFQTNKRVSGPVESGIMNRVWNFGYQTIQSGTQAVQHGAQQAVLYGTQTVQYGKEVAYNSYCSVTGFATAQTNVIRTAVYNRYTQLPPALYAAFAAKPIADTPEK